MEHFMLFNFEMDPQGSILTFLVTRIQEPGIVAGTREMIDQMLLDAGITGITYTSWTVTHLLCNYFSSPSAPVESPETWMDTWEISLQGTSPSAVDVSDLNDRYEIIRTRARDDTWSEGPGQAAPYVIVAHFHNEKLFQRAIFALSQVREPSGSRDPEVDDLIDDVKQHPLASSVSVRQSLSIPLELVITLGNFEEASFPAQGAALAGAVSRLVREFTGTMTWDETTDVWAEMAHFKARSGDAS